VQQDAIGLGEGATRWREVVKNESSFVHGGEEVGAEKFVAQEGKSDDQDRAGGQHPRPLQNSAHRARVKVHDATEKTGEMRFFCGEESGHIRTSGVSHSAGSFFAANQVLTEGGRPRQGQNERSGQRNGHGDGEGAKKSPGDSGNGDKGKRRRQWG